MVKNRLKINFICEKSFSIFLFTQNNSKCEIWVQSNKLVDLDYQPIQSEICIKEKYEFVYHFCEKEKENNALCPDCETFFDVAELIL